MNEILLRRLVGALVLLALAFTLASLLPDASQPPVRPDGGQVVSYDLNTGLPLEQAPAAAMQEPATLEEKVKSPETPETEEEPKPSAPLPAPRSALQLQESLELGAGMPWYVQAGSFENQGNARSALVKLYQMGLPATIQSVQVGNALWYRVRVGPYLKEKQAQQALGAIRKQGFGGAKLIKPESR